MGDGVHRRPEDDEAAGVAVEDDGLVDGNDVVDPGAAQPGYRSGDAGFHGQGLEAQRARRSVYSEQAALRSLRDTDKRGSAPREKVAADEQDHHGTVELERSGGAARHCDAVTEYLELLFVEGWQQSASVKDVECRHRSNSYRLAASLPVVEEAFQEKSYVSEEEDEDDDQLGAVVDPVPASGCELRFVDTQMQRRSVLGTE